MDNRQHSKKATPVKGQSMSEFRSKAWANLLDPVKSFQRAISGALAPNYFQGYADDDVAAHNRLARRRAKNKVARQSRRINRQRRHG